MFGIAGTTMMNIGNTAIFDFIFLIQFLYFYNNFKPNNYNLPNMQKFL